MPHDTLQQRCGQPANENPSETLGTGNLRATGHGDQSNQADENEERTKKLDEEAQ